MNARHQQSQNHMTIMSMLYMILEQSYVCWNAQKKRFQSQKLAYRYKLFIFISILSLLRKKIIQIFSQSLQYIKDFTLPNDESCGPIVPRTFNLSNLHIATLNYGDKQYLNITDHFKKLLMLKHIWRFESLLQALKDIYSIQIESAKDSIELMLIKNGAICIETLVSVDNLFIINR